MSDELAGQQNGDPHTETETREIDETTGWNLRMMRQMAISIREAHAINPNSWCIHSYGEAPMPAVGHINIGSVGPEHPYGLLVDITNANEQQAQIVEELGGDRRSSTAPWWRYLHVPGDRVNDVLEQCGDLHMDAVRRTAEGVKTKAGRWKWHRADLAEEMSWLLGEPLPEPAYLDSLADDVVVQESSGKIHDLSSWPIEVLAWFGDSIRLAHALSPTSWSFRLTSGELSLYVNRPKMLAASPDRVHFLASGESVDTSDGLVRPEQLSRGRSFEYPSTWVADVDPALTRRIRESLGHAHEEIIEILAPKTAVRPTTAGGHDQALVESLGRELGIQLPSPSYLGTLTPRPASKSPQQPLGVASRLDVLFQSAGLKYTAAQLATFYTALQTKGFVVLSGISGTGKSKIAQGFVEFLPTAVAIPLTVQPGYASNGGLTVPNKLATQAGFPTKNASGPIFVSMASAQGEGLVRVRNNYGDNLFTELRPKDSVRDRISDLAPGTMLYARFSDWQDGLPTKAILDSQAPSNSLFLSVRPDWRDSTSLLGYYNPLTETYEWTEFLRFILRAAESFRKEDGLAWFVILDEMNLAHVEYYFADLLSIIESGRDDDGWSREPVRLTYPDGKTDNPPPHEIKLPPNLYIIGTVNMDETTHAFSPKVLDRAFTIELTEVDFSDYPPSPSATNSALSDDEQQALLNAFTRGGKFARIDKFEIGKVVQDHPEIRDWLQQLNVELAKHQFQFGYRVFDEIAQFVHNADANRMFEDRSDNVPAWIRAFDHAVYMKVLPKFNGSHARLHGPLTALLAWAKNPAGDSVEQPEPGVEDTIEAPVAASPSVRLDRVATRAERMLELLEANGFVSFG
jgi:hypothetical protein